MSQDAFASLARAAAVAHLALMPAPKDQRQILAVVIVGIISVAALFLIGHGTPAAAVTDVLAVALPPLVAIAAQAGRR